MLQTILLTITAFVISFVGEAAISMLDESKFHWDSFGKKVIASLCLVCRIGTALLVWGTCFWAISSTGAPISALEAFEISGINHFSGWLAVWYIKNK